MNTRAYKQAKCEYLRIRRVSFQVCKHLLEALLDEFFKKLLAHSYNLIFLPTSFLVACGEKLQRHKQ